jgi:hypothetical protein
VATTLIAASNLSTNVASIDDPFDLNRNPPFGPGYGSNVAFVAAGPPGLTLTVSPFQGLSSPPLISLTLTIAQAEGGAVAPTLSSVLPISGLVSTSPKSGSAWVATSVVTLAQIAAGFTVGVTFPSDSTGVGTVLSLTT